MNVLVLIVSMGFMMNVRISVSSQSLFLEEKKKRIRLLTTDYLVK